jgi:hypothetical protein
VVVVVVAVPVAPVAAADFLAAVDSPAAAVAGSPVAVQAVLVPEVPADFPVGPGAALAPAAVGQRPLFVLSVARALHKSSARRDQANASSLA